jgi:hypothetical protein
MLVDAPTSLAASLAGIAAELELQAAAHAPARGPLAAAQALLLAAFIGLIAALQRLVERWEAGTLPQAAPRRRPAAGPTAEQPAPRTPHRATARTPAARTQSVLGRVPARAISQPPAIHRRAPRGGAMPCAAAHHGAARPATSRAQSAPAPPVSVFRPPIAHGRRTP